MADKAEYAFKYLRSEMEKAAAAVGKKPTLQEKMLFAAFENALPLILDIAPDESKVWLKRIFNLVGYVAGYWDTPSGEE
ncbi:hypothetical protein Ngar_c03550 [Candidatus Nitrososphaera gargensis Ga9.2]|uniref:Uncharacterized protein n=1 Tax=Nitrososphaera gargensis (strain Ga9.2) TaxID=1237085 RepID=K0ILR9_NITGG|nr:hypothetical protein [Candidatus Nitrososphaera gargensis]AFU57274.1 hypothetical protein Ngar_c03260 [Candidatus Nitrososphaera gargensis Ga9.2]AFU57303.1 hypothetical protein Ngar_c03550 [Candidatus Nitrososphaera gargensis Ga9.2]